MPDLFTLTEAVIRRVTLKEDKQTGNVVATAVITTPLDDALAKKIGCYDLAFAKNGTPKSFESISLANTYGEVQLDISPSVGDGITVFAVKLDGFQVSPSEEGLVMAFGSEVIEKAKELTNFFHAEGASQVAINVMQRQMELFDENTTAEEVEETVEEIEVPEEIPAELSVDSEEPKPKKSKKSKAKPKPAPKSKGKAKPKKK